MIQQVRLGGRVLRDQVPGGVHREFITGLLAFPRPAPRLEARARVGIERGDKSLPPSLRSSSVYHSANCTRVRCFVRACDKAAQLARCIRSASQSTVKA